MTIPQAEPPPKPQVPDPEAEVIHEPEVAKKERDDGTELGEQREPA